MAFENPSAPLPQYPEFYPELSNKAPNGALIVYAVNDSCLACKKEINQEKPDHIVILQCKHSYHLNCVRSYLLKDGMECLKCFNDGNKMTSKAKEFSMAPEDDEDVNDEDKRAEIEEYYADLHGECVLSTDQKSQLVGVAFSLRHPQQFLRTKIDMEFLLENDKNLDDLYNIGLDLLDIYFILEIQAWSDLDRLGLTHEHLMLTQKKKPFLPLNQLIHLYEITYSNLIDIGLNMNRSSTYGFNYKELKMLGMTFEKMTDYGMRKKHMFNYKKISYIGWRNLGFTKEHLVDFQFKIRDFTNLRWDFDQVAYKFNLNEMEKEFILDGAKLKKPRKHSKRK